MYSYLESQLKINKIMKEQENFCHLSLPATILLDNRKLILHNTETLFIAQEIQKHSLKIYEGISFKLR